MKKWKKLFETNRFDSVIFDGNKDCWIFDLDNHKYHIVAGDKYAETSDPRILLFGWERCIAENGRTDVFQARIELSHPELGKREVLIPKLSFINEKSYLKTHYSPKKA